MQKKVFWFDVETTGLDPEKHGIIQLAYIVEVDGVEKESGELLIQPFPTDVIEFTALQINGRKPEEIKQEPFLEPSIAYRKLLSIFTKYVDRYNKADKFYPAGYNVSFDCGFLSAWLQKNKDFYYGSYFSGKTIDPKGIVSYLDMFEYIDMPNVKLTTACSMFGVENPKAHDALADIRATKKLSETLTEKWMNFKGGDGKCHQRELSL